MTTFAQQYLHFSVFCLYFSMPIASHLSLSVFSGLGCDQRINSVLFSITSSVEWLNIKTYCTVSVRSFNCMLKWILRCYGWKKLLNKKLLKKATKKKKKTKRTNNNDLSLLFVLLVIYINLNLISETANRQLSVEAYCKYN